MANLHLSSPAFADQKQIPVKYTCDGEDLSPPLVIENVPDGTKSLALIVDDPDAPMGLFVHWLVWNINPRIGAIEERAEPREAVIGKNSWGRNSYGGPCPPSGTHRYMFKLFALDTTLTLPGTAGKEQLEEAMETHILDQALLMGLYRKRE